MKQDFLRIYAIVFGAFAFFSSVKCMYDLIESIFSFDSYIILLFIIAVHIGSLLLIFSGRLKRKGDE